MSVPTSTSVKYPGMTQILASVLCQHSVSTNGQVTLLVILLNIDSQYIFIHGEFNLLTVSNADNHYLQNLLKGVTAKKRILVDINV